MKTNHSGSRTIIILQLLATTLSRLVVSGCQLLIYELTIFSSPITLDYLLQQKSCEISYFNFFPVPHLGVN